MEMENYLANCSFNAINRDYIDRLKVYYSIAKQKKATNAPDYPEKDDTFIKQYPPQGDTIRDMYNAAASSQTNPWCISDHDRHIREIQAVKTDAICCQDHTFQVVKNYMKGLGAKAVWDVATGTGEIASAAPVPSTKTEDFAHAAQQLMKRDHFNPKVKYYDTWPSKKEYWTSICPGIECRLGLFHYQKRIISTLKKNHIDYTVAVTDLLAGLHVYHAEDLGCIFLFHVPSRGGAKRRGKSNVLGIPLFLFLFLAFLLEVSKGTLNLRKIEGKGKAS